MSERLLTALYALRFHKSLQMMYLYCNRLKKPIHLWGIMLKRSTVFVLNQVRI